MVNYRKGFYKNRFYNKKFIKYIYPNNKLGIGDRSILNQILKKQKDQKIEDHSSYILLNMELFGFKSI